MAFSILLTGLPGSGKSSLKRSLRSHGCGLTLVENDWNNGSEFDLAHSLVVCVIDVRSPLEDSNAEEILKALLFDASQVVFSFMAQAELSSQSFWQNWFKSLEQETGLSWPRYRWYGFTENLPWQGWVDDWAAQSKHVKEMDNSLPDGWECVDYYFDYGAGDKPVTLDHLLMGLDAARRNLGQSIWRVKAELMTLEYQNPVQIEGTPNRLDTYAGENEDKGFLKISGIHLDKALIAQIVSASLL